MRISHIHKILPPLFIAIVVCACHKAPRHVIDEKTMVSVMCDMNKVDAYMEQNYSTFGNNDSLRMAVKQSVLHKYGYTIEDFDTSMVWYSRNVDVLSDVFRQVNDQLNDEINAVQGAEAGAKTVSKKGSSKDLRAEYLRKYHASSDSAEWWTTSPVLPITANVSEALIQFEYTEMRGVNQGDLFELKFNLAHMPGMVTAYLAVDYYDRSISFTSMTVSNDGNYKLQIPTQQKLSPRRVYGYFTCTCVNPQATLGYIHNVSLMRIRQTDNTAANRPVEAKTLWRNKDVASQNTAPATNSEAAGTSNLLTKRPNNTSNSNVTKEEKIVKDGKFRIIKDEHRLKLDDAKSENEKDKN